MIKLNICKFKLEGKFSKEDRNFWKKYYAYSEKGNLAEDIDSCTAIDVFNLDRTNNLKEFVKKLNKATSHSDRFKEVEISYKKPYDIYQRKEGIVVVRNLNFLERNVLKYYLKNNLLKNNKNED